MAKHWAIETESSTAGTVDPDFVRGDRPDDPQTPEAAVEQWRKVRQLYFIPATARRTTDEEDHRLQLGLEEAAKAEEERKAQIAAARKLRGSTEGKQKYDEKKAKKKGK